MTKAGAEWAGLLPLTRRKGIKQRGPNPLSREYLAFGIFLTCPPIPTSLLPPSFPPEIQRTQGHVPPAEIFGCGIMSKKDASP